MGKRKNSSVDEFDLSLEGHKRLQPRTFSQRSYLKAIRSYPTTIGIGPAGTGKTYIAAAYAAEKLATNTIDAVVLTRPTVPIENEQIGFLPGGLEKKMDPWTAPVLDTFHETIGQQRTTTLMKEGRIKIVPFAFMRGRTFKDSIVIVDEAQNMTIRQAKALVTRHGEGACYIIDGDPGQSDIGPNNGLAYLIDLVERDGLPVPIIRFSKGEVVRSPHCAMWVKAIERDHKRHHKGKPEAEAEDTWTKSTNGL